MISSDMSTLGGVTSIKMTFCSIMDIFPITSVTVQVTMVSPSGKTSGALFSKEIIPTASKTSGVFSFTRFCVSERASSVMSDNCSISGNNVS